jgi:hypothetical protein
VPRSYISCSQSQKDSSNRNFVECTSSCTSIADCTQVYRNQNEMIMDGLWGNIKFSCLGDFLSCLQGYLIFTDTGNGSCWLDNTSDF